MADERESEVSHVHVPLIILTSLDRHYVYSETIIIINKLSELHRHPILFVHFFSIPTFFHFFNFLYDWFILFFY